MLSKIGLEKLKKTFWHEFNDTSENVIHRQGLQYYETQLHTVRSM